MVVNFRTHKINRGMHKLAQTSTLKKKKKLCLQVKMFFGEFLNEMKIDRGIV